MRMLDLFCGRFGAGRAFAERGWEVVGIDLARPQEVPTGCEFIQRSVLEIDAEYVRGFDFAWASSPCEEFSRFGLRCFHPNPPFPDMGIALFCYTRRIFTQSGVPFVMENVRAAQQFVGNATHHCGPFYLWGNCVPPLMPQGITKGINMGNKVRAGMSMEEKRRLRQGTHVMSSYGSKERNDLTATWATIPPMLSGAVVDYATRILADRQTGGQR